MSGKQLRQDQSVWIWAAATAVLRPDETLRDAARDDRSAQARLLEVVLESRIEQALRATGHLPLRNLQVCAAEELVILRGVVPTYYLKQVAQTAAMGVPGVGEVHNELDVVSL